MRDMKDNITVVRSISPVAVGTTGTGQTGVAVDLKGYDSAAIVASYGTITATAATFTFTLLEGDTTGGSFTSVADADLNGTEANTGLAAGTRTSGSTKNVSKRIGYVGVKRYIKAKIVSTATAGTLISATAILGKPSRAATA